MAVLLVAYDLNHEVRRPPIVKFIKDNFPWAQLSESSYAIETWLPAHEVFKLFEPFLDGNDHLFVIALTLSWHGQSTPEVLGWLSARLPGTLRLAA